MSIPRPESFVHLPLDAEVLAGSGCDDPRFAHDHKDPVGHIDTERNAVVFSCSREAMLDYGLAEPTPEEAARRRRELADRRADEAARNVVRARWLAGLLDVAGDVGRAVLRLHKRDHIGYCGGCGSPLDRCELWPCATVETVAKASGIDVPRGI